LIIAGVAALVTYAMVGEQTPFGLMHWLHRHHPKIEIDSGDGAAGRQAARDSAQKVADATDASIDATQRNTDAVQRAEDIAQRALDMAQAKADEAQRRADDAQDRLENTQASVEGGVASTPAETRDLPSFDSIVLENDAAADVVIGDTQLVSIVAKDASPEAIQTKVRDGKLVVAGRLSGAHVTIIVPHLKYLQVNGAGQVSLEGLRDPISITTNGPVHISASGAVDSADLTLNGPSKAALTKLATKNMRIVLNGVGDAEVNATDTLTADVHGVGRVRYVGEPHTVSTIRGQGSVERLSQS
jgi:hypothetical protein